VSGTNAVGMGYTRQESRVPMIWATILETGCTKCPWCQITAVGCEFIIAVAIHPVLGKAADVSAWALSADCTGEYDAKAGKTPICGGEAGS